MRRASPTMLALASALVLCAVASQRPARADRSTASALFDRGLAAYRAGKFAAAVTAFEQSYRARVHPATLYATAQAYRRWYVRDGKREHAQRAAALYRRFLVSASRSSFARKARQHLAQLRALLGEAIRDVAPRSSSPKAPEAKGRAVVSYRGPAGSVVHIDGKRVGPSPGRFELAPGVHRIEVRSASGKRLHQQTVTLGAGKELVLVVPDADAGATMPAGPKADAGAGAGAGTGAGAGAGAGTGAGAGANTALRRRSSGAPGRPWYVALSMGAAVGFGDVASQARGLVEAGYHVGGERRALAVGLGVAQAFANERYLVQPGVVVRYDIELSRGGSLQLAPVLMPGFFHLRRAGVGFSGFAATGALELRWLATSWVFAQLRPGATLLVFADGSTAARLGISGGVGASF